MRQLYEVWDIVPGRTVEVSIEAVIDDWEGFRILLRDYETDRMMRIAFTTQVCYLMRDESDLEGEAERSDGLGRGCFYRVRHSELALRFKEDSIRQFGDLKHFAVITDTSCIDVLAKEDPSVDQL